MEQFEFHTIRSVPEILNATFALIRESFPELRRTILLYLFPTIFVAELLSALFKGDFVQELLEQSLGITSSGVVSGAIVSTGSVGLDLLFNLFAFALYIVGFTLLIAATFAFIRLKESGGGEEIGQRELRVETMQLFWKVLGTNIGLFLLFSFGAFFLSLFTRGAPDLIGLFIIGVAAFLCWLIVTSALYYPVRFIEEDEFLLSFSRSRELLRGYSWPTFGLLVLSSLVVGTFVSPSFFLTVLWYFLESVGLSLPPVSADGWTILFALLSALLSAVLQFANTVPLICLALHYYSQRERLEGVGLEEKIALIGTNFASLEEKKVP
ncbi:MAG: hypothetical protein KDD67_00060 [Ignavibacteriae bacterium]|nr:hypothetical protein [Ignavibacteriota bacterium]MCB9214771.1 hypothetical protein [Ignavibacteria bacterium]